MKLKSIPKKKGVPNSPGSYTLVPKKSPARKNPKKWA